jgi:hypothetical protein
VFRGITDRLIPLFAIGAFLTFTMSQIGMVVHWRRARRSSRGANRLHLLIWGASATGVALVVIVAAKFTEGAWITVLVIPGVVVLLRSIKGAPLADLWMFLMRTRQEGCGLVEPGPPAHRRCHRPSWVWPHRVHSPCYCCQI